MPCFNRPDDAKALIADLERLNQTRAQIRVILVDNASAVPLSSLQIPPGLDLEHLRLPTNTGGSGGYNAGMRRVLGLDPSGGPDTTPETDRWREFDPEYLWLVDSDARVAPDTLESLHRVLDGDPDIIAAGAAIADPVTGQFFELGGHVNRRNGNYEPHVPGVAGVRALVDCDYVAACCALVRSDAIRAAGVFPDTFLNGDDVEWFLRLKQATGGRVVGVPWASAMHPRFDRFPTWTRYYTSRNALGPLDALGLGRRLRFRRALTEVPRAVQQEMMGRTDLARLHVRGLRDAAKARNRGIAPPGVINVQPQRPHAQLADALRQTLGEGRGRPAHVQADLDISEAERAVILQQLGAAGFTVSSDDPGVLPTGLARQLVSALGRWVSPRRPTVSVVPARGRPAQWFTGRVQVQVAGGTFALARPTRLGTPLRAVSTFARAGLSAVRCALTPSALLAGPRPLDPATAAARARAWSGGTSLEVIVLSHNRWPALERTLTALLDMPLLEAGAHAGHRITVVDNASSDGTPDRVETHFPSVNLIRLEKNVGVEAFNIAAARSSADAILILDDDAIPEPAALEAALGALARFGDLGAVTLHPRHPSTGASEWPFAASLRNAPTDAWPVMGCANLVRRRAWEQAHGYESAFFLYRNDADLALKLLALGWGVRFDPALVAWHDTPAGAGRGKSLRWHELATRNWIFMARRHGGASSALFAILLGWVWAHALAGFSPSRHAATLRGAMKGLFAPAPPFAAAPRTGVHLRRLLRLHALGRWAPAGAAPTPLPTRSAASAVVA